MDAAGSVCLPCAVAAPKGFRILMVSLSAVLVFSDFVCLCFD